MQNLLLRKMGEINNFLLSEKGRRKELKYQLKIKNRKIKLLKKNNSELDKCILLLDHVIKNTEGKIIELFQSTVSAGLKDIFDNSYEFRFDFKKRGNISACDYEIKSKENPHWTNIMMTRGESVCQIIATIIRIILVKIDKDSPDIVIMDEPLGGLNDEKKEIAGNFLHELCHTFGIQLIVITHAQQIADYADKILEVK